MNFSIEPQLLLPLALTLAIVFFLMLIWVLFRLNHIKSTVLAQNLQALALDKEVTLFMLLLAAFNVLLHRYTAQSDICVGSPIANRSRQELDSLIGCFVNTLAFRNDLSGDPTFSELLEQVKEHARSAYEHQDVPFERLVDELGVARDMSHTPLFQTFFVLQNQHE